MEVNTYSDDNTHLNATCLLDGVKELHAASKSFGKDMASVSTWKERFEAIGFVNVHEEVLKVCYSALVTYAQILIPTQLPQSPWPKDPKLKDLGRYHQLNMLEAMPPYTFALFTRILGWKRERIEALLAGIRHELKDLSNHLYTKVHMVYGQRPE